MSIRDLMWLCFMPNERLDDKSLLFEGSTMKNLKLRQVVDVVFGIHNDKAVELGRRVKELEARLSRARSELATTQAFVDEQGLGSRISVELLREEAERAATAADAALRDLDTQIRAATGFAAQLRSDHRDAAVRAQRAAALLRDRETQVRRLVPLRAQYAADVSKLTLLAEARTLFDPLEIKVCPACLSPLAREPRIANGHCSLCSSHIVINGAPSASDGFGDGSTVAVNDSHATAPGFDVSAELRATKSRLAELTRYVEDLDSSLDGLRATAAAADQEEAELATALDTATNRAVSPFISQRDDVMRRKQEAVNASEQARSALRMLEGVDRRAVAVSRQGNALRVLREELSTTSAPADRRDVVQRISLRYADILRAWNYPKQEHAFIDSNLVPHMRGSDYRVASSGGRTLISLAWILAVFETAYESGSAHPGFLMIDSPQKNLGQGNERDAEFADSVAVSDVYKHLHDWLQGDGLGAQVLVVDNAPPETVDDDVVVRYSRRADQPPYGLIEDEVS